MSNKKCAKCSLLKPLDSFGDNKRYLDGKQSYCRDCMYEYDKARSLAKNPPKPKLIAKAGYKFCTKCSEEKLLDQFPKCAAIKSGYKSECKDCTNKRAKDYHQKNPDKAKESKEKYRSSQAGKEKEREYSQSYYSHNRDQILQRHKEWELKNREHRLEYRKEYNDSHKEESKAYREANRQILAEKYKRWREENRGTHNVKCARRRAAIMNAMPSWANIEAIRSIYIKKPLY